MSGMPSDRLTRQELSWLLAQQARSAADTLRRGVTSLAPKLEEKSPEANEVSTTLDALDDAMRTLASLHSSGTSHGRRGRIDLAALLLEIAPGARVEIEPGRGTEVFGDEVEMRRMVQMLVSLGAAGTGPVETSDTVTVRREGELIKVAVALGPDSSASSRMEQAWLHRMATRHGGKLVLGSGEVTLELPGGDGDERREVEGLRKELAAAQEQGEAYARELASMFARTDTSMPPPSSLMGTDPEEGFLPLANLTRQLALHLKPEVAALVKESPRAQVVATWLGALARFADAAEGEEVGSAPASELLALPADVERAARQRGVTVEIAPPTGIAKVRVREASAVAALLIAHCVEATPRGGVVSVSGLVADDGLTITVTDGGCRVPIAARTRLVSLETDPSTVGRPPGVELFLADALIRRRNGALRLDDADVGIRFEAFVPSR